MLPLFVDVTGRKCVVVGGGPVGRRRAATLAGAGAAVIVVDPVPAGALPAGCAWLAGPFHADHLRGAALVAACGPADVNAAVVAAARALGVWVADAADPGRGSAVFPAAGSAGPVTVAVSTGGASPAAAKLLRDRFLAGVTPNVRRWLRLLGRVRAEARRSPLSPAGRRRLAATLAGPDWLARAVADGRVRALAAMRLALAAAVAEEQGGVVPRADAPARGVEGEHGPGEHQHAPDQPE